MPDWFLPEPPKLTSKQAGILLKKKKDLLAILDQEDLCFIEIAGFVAWINTLDILKATKLISMIYGTEKDKDKSFAVTAKMSGQECFCSASKIASCKKCCGNKDIK